MDKNNMLRKSLVLGIIILFIGASIVPGISGTIRKVSDISDLQIKENKNHIDMENKLGIVMKRSDLSGAPPDEELNKTYGGVDSDGAEQIIQTSDGGYIVTGYTSSYGAGESDVWLIKTDENGSELWNKTFGGSDTDGGCSVQQTIDGGYIITGGCDWWSEAGGGLWLIKTDANGTKEWDKTFEKYIDNLGLFVQQTTDGGYIIAGFTGSLDSDNLNIWLIKTDANGNMDWNRTFGGGMGYSEAYSVQQTTDGGYIVVGDTYYGYGRNFDIRLIKTDENGTKEWDKTFGGDRYEFGRSVQQTTDGGYIIGGDTSSYGAGESDVWLIKTDTNGTKIWDKTFGTTDYDKGYSVQQTKNGGYIISGTFAIDDEEDVWVIKTDSNGTEEWNKKFGGTDGDICFSIQQTSDEGYVLGGCTWSYGAGECDAWLIKVAPESTPICGDANNDGNIDVGDVVYLINYLYRGGDPSEPVCVGDVTANGEINIGDVVYLINYLYRGGDPPSSDCCG